MCWPAASYWGEGLVSVKNWTSLDFLSPLKIDMKWLVNVLPSVRTVTSNSTTWWIHCCKQWSICWSQSACNVLYCRSLPLPLLSLPCLSIVLVCAPLSSFLKSFDGGFIGEWALCCFFLSGPDLNIVFWKGIVSVLLFFSSPTKYVLNGYT